jgi:DNA-binding MarR family transcriptional regulator
LGSNYTLERKTILPLVTPRRAQTFRAVPKPSEAAVEDSIARVIAGWVAQMPDLDVEPIAVTARLARLQALVAPRLESVFERFGIRSTDFAILATLVRLAGETISQRRLGFELGLSAGTISLRIDRLVRKGLVVREPDPDDGRGAAISITHPGRELFEACAPEHLANARAVLAGLLEDEREELGRLLGKLLYTLEEPPSGQVSSLDLGLAVDGAPVALERRRAVGLPPLPGLLVRHVDPAGPAAASGIRPGDLLTSADRRPLRTRHDLELALMNPRRARRRVALEITRGAEPMRVWLRMPEAG